MLRIAAGQFMQDDIERYRTAIDTSELPIN